MSKSKGSIFAQMLGLINRSIVFKDLYFELLEKFEPSLQRRRQFSRRLKRKIFIMDGGVNTPDSKNEYPLRGQYSGLGGSINRKWGSVRPDYTIIRFKVMHRVGVHIICSRCITGF